MENGDFWSRDMNSYNHYAYGAVADWVYGNAAGIRPLDDCPGYEKTFCLPRFPTNASAGFPAPIAPATV